MRVKSVDEEIMFKDEVGISEPIYFVAGEIFEVVEKKVMKHDNREWFKLKSKWFSKPFIGYHNPDNFLECEQK